MKFKFKVQQPPTNSGLLWSVQSIQQEDGSIELINNCQLYPTQEAAIIHAMVAKDCEKSERESADFHSKATRFILRMIGSKSSY
jgi:hypothetical protein